MYDATEVRGEWQWCDQRLEKDLKKFMSLYPMWWASVWCNWSQGWMAVVCDQRLESDCVVPTGLTGNSDLTWPCLKHHTTHPVSATLYTVAMVTNRSSPMSRETWGVTRHEVWPDLRSDLMLIAWSELPLKSLLPLYTLQSQGWWTCLHTLAILPADMIALYSYITQYVTKHLQLFTSTEKGCTVSLQDGWQLRELRLSTALNSNCIMVSKAVDKGCFTPKSQ